MFEHSRIPVSYSLIVPDNSEEIAILNVSVDAAGGGAVDRADAEETSVIVVVVEEGVDVGRDVDVRVVGCETVAVVRVAAVTLRLRVVRNLVVVP